MTITILFPIIFITKHLFGILINMVILMNLTAHILVDNFFVTAAYNENPNTESPAAVLKNNRVIDTSPKLLGLGLAGCTKNQALKTFPEIKFTEIKDEIITYRQTELASYCYNLGPRVESVSPNEVFADISGSKPPKIKTFQSLVSDLVPSLGTFVTISVAPNRLLAKAVSLLSQISGSGVLTSGGLTSGSLASSGPFIPGLVCKVYDKFKIQVVKNENLRDFTARLPVEAMWPLDLSIKKRLKSLGLNTFGDISRIPLTMLYHQFGSYAPLIKSYSEGTDDSKVPVFHPPDKVVYHTYCEGAGRIHLEAMLKHSAVSIHKNLRDRGKSYRELALTVIFDDGNRESRTSSFTRGKSDLTSVYHDCLNLLNKTPLDGQVTELCLTAGDLILSAYNQLSLFADPSTIKNKNEDKLAKVCANLSAKYSSKIITTGKNLPVSRREQMLIFVDPLRM